MTIGRHRTPLGALVAASLLVAGCGGDDGTPTVRVAAAASLTEVVDALGEVLAAEDDPVELQTDLGGSSTLAAQIVEGSPADLFLSADEATMARVVDADVTVGEVVSFATNRLVLAVPAGNPAGVASLDDLADPTLVFGRCAAEVPCGRLAISELADAGIEATPDTEEADARTLLGKVEAGELDVALVYATDVAAAEVEPVTDERLDQQNRYQAVRIAGGDVAAAERVLQLLRSGPGASLLAGLGFGPA